jgi:hypothetical protein
MAIPILGDIIDTVGELISEAIVDPDKKRELELKIAELKDRENERIHKEMLGQVEINKIEAASGSLFVAGWRPFIGWVGGIALLWSFVLGPAVEYIARLNGWIGTMPEFNFEQLITIVLAMLGVSASRTVEKINGVSTNDYRDTPNAPINVIQKKKRKKVLGVF